MADSSPSVRLDLTYRRRIHIVGVGGAGMSAIATVLVAMGHQVSGSDLKSSAGFERLIALGVDARIGHDADNVGDAEVITISTAVPVSNPEVAEAMRRNIPVLRRAEALAAIAAIKRTVAVAGTHGKTTTSSMLALVLVEAGLQPSFLIGGDINEVGTGAVWNAEGELLVVEADESDGTFLQLAPAATAIVTSVEPDHLDYYGGLEPMQAAFARFLESTVGPTVVCADDPVASRLGQVAGSLSYGTSDEADYQMVDVRLARSSSRFRILHAGADLGEIVLAVPGLHNARNAAGAVVTALAVGAPFDAARRALSRYGGVARRFEFRGERDGVTYVDDYAHLPGEVSAVLAAARAGDWKRVVAVFQPHRYTRTAALWRDFAESFVDADLLVITDIYSAGEPPRPGISGKLIVEAVLDSHPEQLVAYLPARHDLLAFLRQRLRVGDLCLTLGAGDLTVVPGVLLGESD